MNLRIDSGDAVVGLSAEELESAVTEWLRLNGCAWSAEFKPEFSLSQSGRVEARFGNASKFEWSRP